MILWWILEWFCDEFLLEFFDKVTTEALKDRAVLNCLITFQVSQAKVEMFHQVCIRHHSVENISCLGLDVTLHLKALPIE